MLEQVPGGQALTREVPCPAWKALLDRWEAVENGLLSIVAACLDELIVKAGLTEIEEVDEPHWWQRWRVQR